MSPDLLWFVWLVMIAGAFYVGMRIERRFGVSRVLYDPKPKRYLVSVDLGSRIVCAGKRTLFTANLPADFHPRLGDNGQAVMIPSSIAGYFVITDIFVDGRVLVKDGALPALCFNELAVASVLDWPRGVGAATVTLGVLNVSAEDQMFRGFVLGTSSRPIVGRAPWM